MTKLFHQLKARAFTEGLSLKSLIEKSGYEYLRKPAKAMHPEEVVLPVARDGSGSVLVNPVTWSDEINERS